MLSVNMFHRHPVLENKTVKKKKNSKIPFTSPGQPKPQQLFGQMSE
jgi:hypothetical protein